MTEQQRWYAGVDWASENHHVLITDGEGRKIGAGLEHFAAAAKKLIHSSALSWLNASAMACQSASIVRAAAFLISAFSLEKAMSIGLKSGE